jgi:hypothetical protein
LGREWSSARNCLVFQPLGCLELWLIGLCLLRLLNASPLTRPFYDYSMRDLLEHVIGCASHSCVGTLAVSLTPAADAAPPLPNWETSEAQRAGWLGGERKTLTDTPRHRPGGSDHLWYDAVRDQRELAHCHMPVKESHTLGERIFPVHIGFFPLACGSWMYTTADGVTFPPPQEKIAGSLR